MRADFFSRTTDVGNHLSASFASFDYLFAEMKA
jgi:hypothetical protein